MKPTPRFTINTVDYVDLKVKPKKVGSKNKRLTTKSKKVNLTIKPVL